MWNYFRAWWRWWLFVWDDEREKGEGNDFEGFENKWTESCCNGIRGKWGGGAEELIVLPKSDKDSGHDSNVETDYDSSGHWVYVLLRRFVK